MSMEGVKDEWIAEAAGLLKRLESAGLNKWEDSCCPECDGYVYDMVAKTTTAHKSDCLLARLIRTALVEE